MLFMENIYIWLLGELSHRPWQRYEHHADVMKCYISFTAFALKNYGKVACLINKEQQAEAELQLVGSAGSSALTGRLKQAYRTVQNCGAH